MPLLLGETSSGWKKDSEETYKTDADGELVHGATFLLRLNPWCRSFPSALGLFFPISSFSLMDVFWITFCPPIISPITFAGFGSQFR